MESNGIEKYATIKSQKYYCSACDYGTCRKSSYDIHILTFKHKKTTSGNPKLAKTCKTYKCENCNKIYIERSGLWKHKKKCNYLIIQNNHKDEENIIDTETIMTIIQQNQEFKELIIEQNNKIIELSKGKCIVNNTNNNHFNLNIFLNEQCKDAINLMDFINSLSVQLEDLENTGKFGYVQGISKIFIRGLKELDVTKRPIHCSDLKRETLYVKDNTWEKDNEKKQMKRAIRHIACKNFKQITEWVEENPDSKDIESKKHQQYMRIINKSTGGIDEEEDEMLYKKIISNVAKEVMIDK
jgi:hypothetical protein